MSTLIEDKRIVIISVTSNEIKSLLGAKAKQVELIDFNPDKVSIKPSKQSGMAYDIIFEINTIIEIANG